MKWHLRGFCLFSGLPKAVSMFQKQKTPPVETLSQKPRQHGDMKQFPLPVRLLPPVVNHIYHVSCVCNGSAISIGGETRWGKLTRLTCTKLKSHKAFVFREHHHYFILPGKWTAQFCLITSRALMHYQPRRAFATFRGVVRRRDKLYQHSWGRAACLMIISHFARLNSIFWIKDSVWRSEWMGEKEGATGCRWKEVAPIKHFSDARFSCIMNSFFDLWEI